MLASAASGKRPHTVMPPTLAVAKSTITTTIGSAPPPPTLVVAKSTITTNTTALSYNDLPLALPPSFTQSRRRWCTSVAARSVLESFDGRLILLLKALREGPPIPKGEADKELWYNHHATTLSRFLGRMPWLTVLGWVSLSAAVSLSQWPPVSWRGPGIAP